MQLVAVYYLACATLATATLVLLSLAVFTDSWDVASVSGLQPGLANLTGDWRLVEVVEGRLDILYRDGVVTSHDLWVNNPSVWAATKVHCSRKDNKSCFISPYIRLLPPYSTSTKLMMGNKIVSTTPTNNFDI